jgi:hypothetical protein
MNGYGFWIKFATADTIVYNGSPIISDTIHLKSGWNLIGSISTPLNTSMIVADPPESIVSQYFLYDGSSYHTTDTIKPGLGYWVKANGVAALILSGTTQKKSVIPSKILPEGIQIDSALLKKINR